MCKRKKYIIGLTFLIILVSLLSHIDYIGLRAEEPRRAIVGVETYVSGNFIVPQIHNETYYNKPPVYNWILALFYFIFQSFEEWVVRLPGIIFFLLTGLFTYKITQKHINKETGVLAALFYLTSADLLFYGTINAGEIDLFYSFIVGLQAYSIFFFFHRKQYLLLYLLSYTFTFIGVMTKGIPSFAFQAITILVVILYYKKWKLLFGWQHISGILLLSVLLGGYFYLYDARANLNGFLTQQFAESSDKSFNEGTTISILKTIFQFPLQLLTIALPWSILLLGGFYRQVRTNIKSNPLTIFSILFIVSNILIYWISPGVRNRYLYMFIPFMSILAAKIFVLLPNIKRLKGKSATLFALTAMVLSFMLIMTFPFFTNVSQHASHKWLYTVSFLLIIGLVFFYTLKQKHLAIYLFILIIAIGRLWFNVSVLPFLKHRSTPHTYAEHVEKINQITDGAQVYWTGKPIISTPEVKIAGNTFMEAKFSIPPWIPYAIPYYQFKNTYTLMSYDSVPDNGRYYLGPESQLPQMNIDTLYRFREKWHHYNLILFKLKAE